MTNMDKRMAVAALVERQVPSLIVIVTMDLSSPQRSPRSN
jgi:hypothetical protein